MGSIDHINQDVGVSLVITTLPDDESFQALARSLLDQGLIACANGLPGARSVYRWKGEVESASEVLALLKTRGELVPRLTEAIVALHPYELPEVVAVPVVGGLGDYIDWIKAQTRDASS